MVDPRLSRRPLLIALAIAAASACAAPIDLSAVQKYASTQLKNQAQKANAILGVLAAAITFGTALTAGALGPVLSAAGALANAAASASS